MLTATGVSARIRRPHPRPNGQSDFGAAAPCVLSPRADRLAATRFRGECPHVRGVTARRLPRVARPSRGVPTTGARACGPMVLGRIARSMVAPLEGL